MLHRSVCFSCRILKFEVCAQVAAESPECPANTVLVLFWWLTQHPACQVTHWGWPNKQRACGVCVYVCACRSTLLNAAAAVEGEVNIVHRGAAGLADNTATIAIPTRQHTWWVCVANREAFIKFIPSGAWMRADGVHPSLRINRKEEVSASSDVKTNSRQRVQLDDFQLSFMWLAVWYWLFGPGLIHEQSADYCLARLFPFSEVMSTVHYHTFVNKLHQHFRGQFCVNGGQGEDEMNRKIDF